MSDPTESGRDDAAPDAHAAAPVRHSKPPARPAPTPSPAHAWRTIRLADDDRNDIGAYLLDLDVRLARDPGADVMPLLGDDGQIYTIDLSSRPDNRNANPAARPVGAHATATSIMAPSPRIQAILNSGIAQLIGPGLEIRAMVSWDQGTAQERSHHLGIPLDPSGLDDSVALTAAARTPRIVAIGPIAIIEHPHEMAVAEACGIDVGAARRWIRALTTWPTRRNRARSPDARMSATRASIAGVHGDVIRLSLSTSIGRRLALSEGCVILTDVTIPESVALHAVGRPLADIVDIETLAHLPLVAHSIDANTRGTVIDYAPASGEIDITYERGGDQRDVVPHHRDPA